MLVFGGDEHPRIIGNGWLERRILIFILCHSLFRLFCSLYLVLTEPVDNVCLQPILFRYHLIDLLTGWTNHRFLSIKFRLLHIMFYLLLVESMGLYVIVLVQSIADLIGFLLAQSLFYHLQFQKLFVLPLISLLFLSKLLLPLLLQVRLSLFHDILGSLVDGRFGVSLVKEERMGILHAIVYSLVQLTVH